MTVQVGCTNGFGGCVFPALTASRNPRLESCPPVPSEGHRDDRSTHGRRTGLDVGGPQTNACPPPVRRERTSPPARDSTNEGTCQRIVPANVRHTTWSIGSRELDPRRPCCKCSRHPMAFTPPVVVSTRRLAEPRPSHPTLLHPKRSCKVAELLCYKSRLRHAHGAFLLTCRAHECVRAGVGAQYVTHPHIVPHPGRARCNSKGRDLIRGGRKIYVAVA